MNKAEHVDASRDAPQRYWRRHVGILAPLVALSVYPVLNLAGFCFDENRFLDRQATIRDGISAVIAYYPSIRFAYNKLPPGGMQLAHGEERRALMKYSDGIELEQQQLVPYRDVDEFRAVNPGCCSFTPTPEFDEFPATSFLDKATGRAAGFVNIRFLVRFRDSSGQLVSRLSAYSFGYTNCGRPMSF
ncbi:hypothetical protein [Ramlibacter sp. AN1133]|uniref:hypothetical protein n=1 Tax=Ramlibacter sp. AN1133 TaxID=3133429 RepID=UPI0030BE98FE